jgi:hypothetical protein
MEMSHNPNQGSLTERERLCTVGLLVISVLISSFLN